ncbi:MAG TPA: glycogen/starch synthase [Spirochaetota bacterium]|nr:glycogen/starch synthase [Spirochaetota bacterium]
MENSTFTSLSRFRISDEHLITDRAVKSSLSRAYREGRTFDFYPDAYVIERIAAGDPVEMFRERFFEMTNSILDSYTDMKGSFREKLSGDTRLFIKIINALALFHKGAAECSNNLISTRRIVLVKELPGRATIHHVSPSTTVIAHVGQGPEWAEVPTIYLGLKTFETLNEWKYKKEPELFDAFVFLLEVEERAIETGFNHSTVYPPESSALLNRLVDSVIEHASKIEERYREELPPVTFEKFSEAKKNEIIHNLNARLKGDELNFDYDLNIAGLHELENYARLYKKGGNEESFREIIKILVAASGHDIHEIRNRANMILDRVFSPKEYDAPLATRFINLRVGEEYNFNFQLAEPDEDKNYFLRIYRTDMNANYNTAENLNVDEIPLQKNEEDDNFQTSYTFSEYGHYDFAVILRSDMSMSWINENGTSGRMNVLPDLRGEVILEIFVDIHGHTKMYWRENNGNPGLVYNEHGQVIRLGSLSDITHHLEDLKSRYCITAIYLLGVQKRGNNREDWAPEASSPSPFSPVSLTEIEPSLGGEDELKKLVTRAHSMGIKIIVDIIPHLNRKSSDLPDEYTVLTYDTGGNLVERASTDGRYGTWNDGKLLNYRYFEIWEWLSDSICTLIDKYDIDGIRFDSAHAIPIMMKKNNFLYSYKQKRTDLEMLCGNIIVNDREYGHFITTGFYDCECRERISVPIHYFLMQNIERKINEKKKKFFINIAECFWGHEKFLTRTGLVPYNSALFKICENITHGKTDVREIYHVYDNYFPTVMPEGTELLGILGNHDERRALNTFGHRGLRAAVALTSFMSSIIMDYEGSAEGEGWKVYLDNIYVNWNQFEYASHRSLENFYRDVYRFHTTQKGHGALIWANNNEAAAALKFTGSVTWVGIFNFSDSNQNVSLQFDNPRLDINDDDAFILSDPLYSAITGNYRYYTGKELKISRINTTVTYTERIKLLKLEKVSLKKNYDHFLADSFTRLCELERTESIYSNFAFSEIGARAKSYNSFTAFIRKKLLTNSEIKPDCFELGIKRSIFHLHKNSELALPDVREYLEKMSSEKDFFRTLYEKLSWHYRRGSMVFMSAEAEPFSKSGGLANVVYELPRELAKLHEDVYVITPYYRNGNFKEKRKMDEAVEKYGVTYTGKNVRFKIMDADYEVGVHYAEVEGIKYYLLDHYEFFNGLYWGITSEERLRKRVAFARACAEVILTFGLEPKYTFTNDAFPGIFNGIVRCDPYYDSNPIFRNCAFIHIIHNGGWQYFDSYHRFENGFDLFNIFNLPSWRANDFCDPVHGDKLNCMAAGIKFARQCITVSPSYAKQIEIACDGLEWILDNVKGISNAIGADFSRKTRTVMDNSGFERRMYPQLIDRINSDSELSEKIHERYPEILHGEDYIQRLDDPVRGRIVMRMMNKLMLQLERNLKVDPDLILASMIHRISEQKGFQLLLESSEGIFRTLGFQIIAGGAISAGDNRGEAIAHGLYLLTQYYPDRFAVSFGFQDVSVPLLCSDYFLMPSLHEPGGISQLEAMSTGCPVIARATGGLRDTIKPVMQSGDNIEGSGFLFSDFTPWAFYDAMSRAADFYRNSDERSFMKIRENAEKSAYYWDRPAREYIETVYNLTETIRMD